MLYFYATGNTVGVFTAVSLQTHELCVCYNVKMAIMPLGDRNFSTPYDLMGLMFYMWSIVDQYVIL